MEIQSEHTAQPSDVPDSPPENKATDMYTEHT